MNLTSQKNMAARILKCGKTRVWLDPARSGDISEAITTADIRRLVKDGVIKELPKTGVSSYRKKKMAKQKKKGRRKDKGSRKGKIKTRFDRKKSWIKRIRPIRKMIKELKENGKIGNMTYKDLYIKSKSGLFRSKSHLMTYLERNDLLKGEENVTKKKGKKD